MTRDDIIRMAREAEMGEPRELGVNDYWAAFTSDLERFAALVAAAEREACAQVCEYMAEEQYDDIDGLLEMAAGYIRGRRQI